MSAARFFVPRGKLSVCSQVALPQEIAHQVSAVLRLQPSQEIRLLDGSGSVFTCVLDSVTKQGVTGTIVAQEKVVTEPHTQLTLFQGMLKAAKFEWIIQKGTEIGISRFVPITCERSVSGLDDVSEAKLNRWRTIATEAAEQSDRGIIPTIANPISFSVALEGLSEDICNLIAWENAADTVAGSLTIATALGYTGAIGTTITPNSNHVALFIGPEGGFTAAEITQAQRHHAHVVTLGPRILRAETAALVAATLVLSARGDLE